MNPNTPPNGCEINVRSCFAQYIKQLFTKICFSSLDVSEMLGVSSMYNVIMHCLNSFLSCSNRNLTLASLSHLFTIKIDVFPFFKF